MSRVAELGCIICGSPAELHHPRTGQGMGQRASNFDVIPLCFQHHRGGKHGVAYHSGRKAFEANFGTEEQLLQKVKQRLDVRYV
jgi:hypothetical protein